MSSEKLQLQSLPDEIIDIILESATRSSQIEFSLTSRWGYSFAVKYIWRDVSLCDEGSWRPLPPGRKHGHRSSLLRREARGEEEVVPTKQEQTHLFDDHDETRMFKKLFVLATNPYVASKVQTIIHRCHLPPPELFSDLPIICHEDLIHSRNPQHDSPLNPRNKLIFQAIANMTNVHTLRIVYGHWAIVEALLWGFFGPLRHLSAKRPVTKLWLESCSLQTMIYDESWGLLDFSELESLRLRRLRYSIAGKGPANSGRFWAARGTDFITLRNHTSGFHTVSAIATSNIESGLPKNVTEACEAAVYFTELSLREVLRGPPLPASLVHFTHSLTDTKQQLAHDIGTMQTILNYAYALHSTDAVLRVVDFRDLFRNLTNKKFQWIEKMAYNILSQFVFKKDDDDNEQMLRYFRAFTACYLITPMDVELTEKWASYALALSVKIQEEFVWLQDFCAHKHFRFFLPSILNSWSDFPTDKLKFLTLDWVMFSDSKSAINQMVYLQFPNLRAFQLRNSIASTTDLHESIYLFGDDLYPDFPANHDKLGMLHFMENHPKLVCLGWRMDRFFPSTSTTPAYDVRIRDVIANLARNLVDLRVDTTLSTHGEAITDEDTTEEGKIRCRRRRQFIEVFAAEMRALKSIKMEGGIPRDEKREVTRALHHCPLEKVVFIGSSFPLMNTWGQDGELLHRADPSHLELPMLLEPEDDDMIRAAAEITPRMSAPDPLIEQDFVFEAGYGTSHKFPLLYELALHHRSTIKELKFCGYSGAPILKTPRQGNTTPEIDPNDMTYLAMQQLRHFDALEEIVMSFWLVTWCDGDSRDTEIIKYWLSERDAWQGKTRSFNDKLADSSALSTPMGLTDPSDPLQQHLQDQFHPYTLAKSVRDFLKPHLSPVVLNRPGGIRIRASFCLGDDVQDIFDFDIRMDATSFQPGMPKEDSWNGGRAPEKMAERRWF